MDAAEVEEHLFSIGEPKLHGGMCKILSALYCKVLAIFPDLEAARPRSTSGIQALCSLHIALEKTKNILQVAIDSATPVEDAAGPRGNFMIEECMEAWISMMRANR